MSFTPQELRLLQAADAVIDANAEETSAQKNARQSRESRERRRMRLGDAAYRKMCRDRLARWKESRS
jgi:hypothetical protein